MNEQGLTREEINNIYNLIASHTIQSDKRFDCPECSMVIFSTDSIELLVFILYSPIHTNPCCECFNIIGKKEMEETFWEKLND